MATLNLSGRELKTRRFRLLARSVGGRDDVALGILSHLWLRCLEDKTDTFAGQDVVHFLVCPDALINPVLAALVAGKYLAQTSDGYVCVDVTPWLAKAHVRLARAKKAGAASVTARAAKRKSKAVSKTSKLPVKSDAALKAQRACWEAYRDKYWTLFHVEPCRNAKVNALIKQFCQRVPMLDAPHVLHFYVGHGSSFYAQRMYPLDLAVKDAEGLYAQWATDRPITKTTMEQFEQRQKSRAALDAGISF